MPIRRELDAAGCAPQGEDLLGRPDESSSYRRLDSEAFRTWPEIKLLVVGRGSHHGSQRLFARGVVREASATLRRLEAASR